jgi:class 3 adenylate cyclase
MVEVSETRYARTISGDYVAYQATGEGPRDVIVLAGGWLPIDVMWEEPRIVHFLNRLSSFGRHLWFDPRGTGASSPIAQTEGRLAEGMMEDIVAVIDDVGCERVVLLQLGHVAGTGLLFAATRPERVAAIVLVNTSGRLRSADGYPQGYSNETIEESHTTMSRLGHLRLDLVAPSVAGDESFQRWFARASRLAASPDVFRWRLASAYDVDARGLLNAIQAPTLVVYRRDTGSAAQCQYLALAEHIPGAQLVELEGRDLLPFAGDTAPVLDAIEEFLTGGLSAPDPDRVLATVLFTDLVSSTPQLAEMGDRRWRNLIATHDALVRTELDRYRGREVRFDGDGVLATFDGPGRAIRCACAIRDALGALGLEVRAGLHTGEIEQRGDQIEGIAVVMGKRISSMAGPGEVLVSRTVADLVAGSGIEFRDEGEHELKGVPGTSHLYRVA